MINLSEFVWSEFSQFGQDGIILKLSELINPKKYFVEFGSSGNDIGYGNTPALRHQGWNGLLMDCAHSLPEQYTIMYEKVSASNIQGLLDEYNVPHDLGFMSIDIDGQDYWVWDAIKKHKPDIICIEANHNLGHERVMTVPKDDDFKWTTSEYYGASRRALLELGNSKGYDLVSICVSDMIFVKTEHTKQNKFFGINDLDKLDFAQTYRWNPKWKLQEINSKEWVYV